MVEIKEKIPLIDSLANTSLSFVGKNLTNVSDGHIETDIAATALLAGQLLLKNTIQDIKDYNSGEIVFSNVKNTQKYIFEFMINTLHSFGIDYVSGWDLEIPYKNKPVLTIKEMIITLQGKFDKLLATSILEKEYFPYVPALASMKLISIANREKILDPIIGKSIAAKYLVIGGKTIPY